MLSPMSRKRLSLLHKLSYSSWSLRDSFSQSKWPCLAMHLFSIARIRSSHAAPSCIPGGQKAGSVTGGGGMLGDQVRGQVKIEVISQHFSKNVNKIGEKGLERKIFRDYTRLVVNNLLISDL